MYNEKIFLNFINNLFLVLLRKKLPLRRQAHTQALLKLRDLIYLIIYLYIENVGSKYKDKSLKIHKRPEQKN